MHFAGEAQINLVLNPSFEEYSNCPDNLDETKYCNHWMSLDSNWNPPDWTHELGGIPDYCNICAPFSRVSTPYNVGFYHFPKSGRGMMQVVMFCSYLDNFTEKDYLQGHLSQTLIAGHTYNVCFYATMEQSSIFAVNHIGAYLDDGSVDTTQSPGKTQIQYTPQILDTNIINDTFNWIRIQDTFTAKGTEKLITIGNFFDNAHTHAIPLIDTTGIGHGVWTPYLIDDVSVIDCGNSPYAGNDTLIHPGDSAFLGIHEALIPYTWYVLGNPTPIDSGGGLWVKPSATTVYILEQDLCNVKKFDTVKVRVWPDTVTAIDAIRQFDNLTIYPSPTSDILHIEGAKGSQMTVYDVVGREVLAGIIAGDQEIIHLEQIVRGVYVVQLVDPVTGLRLVRQVVRE